MQNENLEEVVIQELLDKCGDRCTSLEKHVRSNPLDMKSKATYNHLLQKSKRLKSELIRVRRG